MELKKKSTSVSLTMWKILKKMEISDHFTCLLRNLYEGRGVTVRTEHGTTHWFKIGKRVYCSLNYLIYVQITS